jgi:hypothetical protein
MFSFRKKFEKFFIAIVFITFLSSCQMNRHFFDFSKPGAPEMKWMYDGPPPSKDGKPHNELYVEGWVDGCETGVAGNTNSFYKEFHQFKQDAMKAQNEIYYKGWKDAFFYCGRYIYQWNRKTGF